MTEVVYQAQDPRFDPQHRKQKYRAKNKTLGLYTYCCLCHIFQCILIWELLCSAGNQICNNFYDYLGFCFVF